jgi:SAM-dependent methyltransferase
MAERTDPRRRDSFDAVAEDYDKARPRYPERLVADLVTLADVGEGSKLLEIGPGTGQLTVPLAERGARLVAVERGPRLAELVRRKLSRFEYVEVVTADFDHWSTHPGSFNVVIAATSFHWLDPSTRMARCATLLRPGGRLAVVQTRWGVAQGDDPFFVASRICYSRWRPNDDQSFRQPRPADVPDPCRELTAHQFGKPVHRRYLCAREYSAAAYCALLSTFSDVLMLDVGHRVGFLSCISDLINSQFGGSVVRHDMYDLCIAPRLG